MSSDQRTMWNSVTQNELQRGKRVRAVLAPRAPVALFVDTSPDGIYPRLLGDDQCWGVERDARWYFGPDPVVAHPPCQLWINLAHVNYKRWGGEHNRPGNDGDCFASALAAVRLWGGVLEHPAKSHAWAAHDLLTPIPYCWSSEGHGSTEWVCEVWQSAYGHKAAKATWLFLCWPHSCPPPELDWRRDPGTHQIGWFDRIKPTLGKKEASATPEPFARLLINLAARCALL